MDKKRKFPQTLIEKMVKVDAFEMPPLNKKVMSKMYYN